ncbi:MAG: hypothetical protein LBT47_09575 [Deltaproteobacteria bacterium]|jgi:hypothetical protein|nr:hypothetical protein [Deltaproteobacteria bacterium]
MKIIFLSLILIFSGGCFYPAGQTGDHQADQTTNVPEPCPAPSSTDSCRSDSWVGQPIGSLIASWGKPVQIAPVQEHPGFYDYIFSSSRRISSSFPFFSAFRLTLSNYRGVFGRFDRWDAFDDFGDYYVTCQAKVRVANNGNIGCLWLTNDYICARHSPFGPSPREIQ